MGEFLYRAGPWAATLVDAAPVGLHALGFLLLTVAAVPPRRAAPAGAGASGPRRRPAGSKPPADPPAGSGDRARIAEVRRA
jgi:hypothetical protein